MDGDRHHSRTSFPLERESAPALAIPLRYAGLKEMDHLSRILKISLVSAQRSQDLVPPSLRRYATTVRLSAYQATTDPDSWGAHSLSAWRTARISRTLMWDDAWLGLQVPASCLEPHCAPQPLHEASEVMVLDGKGGTREVAVTGGLSHHWSSSLACWDSGQGWNRSFADLYACCSDLCNALEWSLALGTATAAKFAFPRNRCTRLHVG